MELASSHTRLFGFICVVLLLVLVVWAFWLDPSGSSRGGISARPTVQGKETPREGVLEGRAAGLREQVDEVIPASQSATSRSFVIKATLNSGHAIPNLGLVVLAAPENAYLSDGTSPDRSVVGGGETNAHGELLVSSARPLPKEILIEQYSYPELSTDLNAYTLIPGSDIRYLVPWGRVDVQVLDAAYAPSQGAMVQLDLSKGQEAEDERGFSATSVANDTGRSAFYFDRSGVATQCH